MSEEVDLNSLDEHGNPIDQHPERRKRFEERYRRAFGGARMGLTQAVFEQLRADYDALDAEQRAEAVLDLTERQITDQLFLFGLRIDILLTDLLAHMDNVPNANCAEESPSEEILRGWMTEQRRLQDRLLEIQERRLKVAEKRLRAEALWSRSGTAKARKPKPAPAEQNKRAPSTATAAAKTAPPPQPSTASMSAPHPQSSREASDAAARTATPSPRSVPVSMVPAAAVPSGDSSVGLKLSRDRSATSSLAEIAN